MAGEATFSAEEIERYQRHLVLPEIGGPGQARLKAARLLIIGAGGLGAPVALYCAAAGIGTIGIIDDDHVSLSNLQRQIIHGTDTVGSPKVESAAAALHRVNPHVQVKTHPERLTQENGPDLFACYDVIADGSDNFATRFLAADLAEELEIPLVTAAVGRFDGTLTVLRPFEGDNPSWRDLYPEPPPDGLVPTCAEAGVLGALTGIVGSMQALEVIKQITAIGEPLVGRLLLYDSLSQSVETITYRRRSDSHGGWT